MNLAASHVVVDDICPWYIGEGITVILKCEIEKKERGVKELNFGDLISPEGKDKTPNAPFPIAVLMGFCHSKGHHLAIANLL